MDLTVVARFGVLLIRPGMLVMLAPGLSGQHINTRTKIGLTVLIAIGLLPPVIVPGATIQVPLPILIAREIAIGLSIAFVLRALIAGAEFAGHLSGYQIGFSYGGTGAPQHGGGNLLIREL